MGLHRAYFAKRPDTCAWFEASAARSKSRDICATLSDVNTVDQLIPGPSEAQLGNLLRELRCMQGLETEQLARRSGLDVEVIVALERGRHGADVATLRRVAMGLGMRVGVIFTLWERRSFVLADE
jgi:DNA-binding XRE family transcriptional regulator